MKSQSCSDIDLFSQQEEAENERLRGLLAEAIEGMEPVPATPGSWLERVREALRE